MIKVYQAKEPTFFPARGTINLSAYELVAEVPVSENAKNIAYQLTNSIHMPWFQNPNIKFLGCAEYGMAGCRSTSIGDLMQDDTGTFFEVASFGFKQVTVEGK